MKSKTKIVGPAKQKIFSRIAEDNSVISEATLCNIHFRKDFYSRVNKYYPGKFWVENKDDSALCIVCDLGEEF